MTRWEALLRFDDEIRNAAMKLLPFGPGWVDQMGEAFFALNEDRAYLLNIVNRLIEEATFEHLEAERAAARQWLTAVERMPSGEQITKESLAVFVELQARGYQIVREGSDVAISLTGRGTSLVRSNEEVMRLGGILLANPRSE